MTSDKVSDKGDFPFNLNERTDVNPANRDYLLSSPVPKPLVPPIRLERSEERTTHGD